jgi:hypothetical protein
VVDFNNQASIVYAGSFIESVANDGSVTGSITATLTGDTYVSPLGTPLHVVISNIPAGLTPVVTRTSATVMTLTLSGTATNHSGLNDIANLGITWQDGAFANTTLATNVTSNTFTAGVVDFSNQASVAWSGNFTETSTNAGTVAGTRIATLSGDTFIAGVANGTPFTQGTHYTVANVPAGLTAVVTKTSATVATVTLTGSATAHANVNDIANLTVTFQDGVFTTTPLAVNVTGSSDAFGVVDFADQPSIAYGGSFAEPIINDGTLTGSRTSTLTGDTFVPVLTQGTHFTLANVPAGLTAVMTRTTPTVATLTFTGSAAANNNVNDVANLTITWLSGAFTNVPLVTNVANASDATGVIDFIEPGTGSITYDSATLTEAAINNGTIGNVLTLTLAGDTYATNLTVGTNVTVTNVPAGLTAVITKVSATVATLTLTG